MSDSFILMVILLTASVALLNILRRPAPLNVWVPTARGSYKTKKAGVASYLLPLFQVQKNQYPSDGMPKTCQTNYLNCSFLFSKADKTITSMYRGEKKKSKDKVKQNQQHFQLLILCVERKQSVLCVQVTSLRLCAHPGMNCLNIKHALLKGKSSFGLAYTAHSWP